MDKKKVKITKLMVKQIGKNSNKLNEMLLFINFLDWNSWLFLEIIKIIIAILSIRQDGSQKCLL